MKFARINKNKNKENTDYLYEQTFHLLHSLGPDNCCCKIFSISF